MLVQLVTLAGLNHIIPRHYVLNSLVAVETAILHNFVAHVHYTWRDRIARNARRDQRARMLLVCSLWRFQVSNGAVSLVGNAVLMKLLVGGARVPVLLANLIAIVMCGLANFWVGDNWAFRARSRSGRFLCQSAGVLSLVLVLVASDES
jgi:putative flippase GtrA